MAERKPRRVPAVLAAAAALIAVVALSGCGVSTSGAPVKIGGPARVDGANDGPQQPDGPGRAVSPEGLVQLYLWAAAGGDNGAPARMREFLTKKAVEPWHQPDSGQAQPPPLTIIRIVDDIVDEAPQQDRTPVRVKYQVVGTLNDQGQVSDLAGVDTSKINEMTFYVVADPVNGSFRIDQIVGGADITPGVVMSDDALQRYYRPQPIYFWDSTNSHLIPDLRYLPFTLGPDQRAQKVVQWLLDGPSPWLLAGAPTSKQLSGATIKDGVTTQNGTWVINLGAPSGAVGADAVKRFYYQLQWSLRLASVPSIALSIEGKRQIIAGAPEDYLRYNLSYELEHVRQKSYDIVNGKVVAVFPPLATAPPLPQPNVLTQPDNAGVLYAAVNRAGDAAALVRTGTDGKRFLEIIRAPEGSAHVLAKITTSKTGTLMGRPTWIPGTDLVLVPAGGKIWLVQSNGDAREIILTHKTGITSVSVAPDGRRIAWVEGEDAFVAPLIVEGTNVNIGTAPRAVMAQQLHAVAIAWTNEAWLYVVGKGANGKGATWQTTVDSGRAINVTAGLKDAAPTDVVALADGPAQAPGQVLLYTESDRYTFGGTVLGGDSSLKPFFVT